MKKEFILCAAVDYNGVIVCGRRHCDCYKILCSLLNIDKDDEHLPDRRWQGFITSTNRFVDRKEAFIIAKENNQICHTMFDYVEDGILTSEDLY